MRFVFLGLFFVGFFASSAGWSQTASGGAVLVPPRAVVLYVHADLKDDAFVDPLICELRRVLVAPVRARSLTLPIGPEIMASATQVDLLKLVPRIVEATKEDGGPELLRFLLTPHDLSAENKSMFGFTMGRPYNSGAVSTARLAPAGSTAREDATRLTMERTYKVILRQIARRSGYRMSDGCVLANPLNLGALDAKTSEFCADDRVALVRAGLLKARPSGGCGPVAQLDRKIL